VFIAIAFSSKIGEMLSFAKNIIILRLAYSTPPVQRKAVLAKSARISKICAEEIVKSFSPAGVRGFSRDEGLPEELLQDTSAPPVILIKG